MVHRLGCRREYMPIETKINKIFSNFFYINPQKKLNLKKLIPQSLLMKSNLQKLIPQKYLFFEASIAKINYAIKYP